jgi:hypothetical protein
MFLALTADTQRDTHPDTHPDTHRVGAVA